MRSSSGFWVAKAEARLATSDFSQVKMFAPFDDFRRSPIPSTAGEYVAYENAARAFIAARNARVCSRLAASHRE